MKALTAQQLRCLAAAAAMGQVSVNRWSRPVISALLGRGYLELVVESVGTYRITDKGRAAAVSPEKETPQFATVEGKSHRFLGRWSVYDLYVHRNTGKVAYRYSNHPRDIAEESAPWTPDDAAPALVEARRRIDKEMADKGRRG